MKFFERYPFIMVLIGILGISVSGVLVRYSDAPSTVTAAYRLLWTVILLSPVVLGRSTARHELFHVSRKLVLLSALSGVLLAIHFSTWFESLQHTSVAVSTVIVCTEMIWVALGYCIFLKGRMGRFEILAALLTLAGSVVIALGDATGEGNHLYGDLLALAAAVAVGGYTLLGRVVRKENVSTTVYTYIVYCCCAIVLTLMVFAGGHSLVGYGWNSLIVGLLLAICSTILGHSIFSWCLKYFSPTFVSASKLCEPVGAGILAAILFQEYPGVYGLLGGIIILAGVVWYSVLESRK